MPTCLQRLSQSQQGSQMVCVENLDCREIGNNITLDPALDELCDGLQFLAYVTPMGKVKLKNVLKAIPNAHSIPPFPGMLRKSVDFMIQITC